MTNLSYSHLNTYRAGSSGYQQHIRDRFNGSTLVRVIHDSKIYIYDNARDRRAPAKEWRAFIAAAWASELNNGARITGRFPCYEIA